MKFNYYNQKIVLMSLMIFSFINIIRYHYDFSDFFTSLRANQSIANAIQVKNPNKDDEMVFIASGSGIKINGNNKIYTFEHYDYSNNSFSFKNGLYTVPLDEINFIEFSPVNKNKILGLLGGMAGGYTGMLAGMFGGCIIAGIVSDGNIYDNPIPGITGITVALIGVRQGYIAGSNFGWGKKSIFIPLKGKDAWEITPLVSDIKL